MAKLTQETLKSFRKDFEQTIKALEAKYDMNMSIGNIRFDEGSFRTTFSASNKSTTINVTGDRSLESIVSGIPVSHALSVGSKWRLPGKRSVYTITGFNPRAPKYSVQVITENGARYRMTSSAFTKATKIS